MKKEWRYDSEKAMLKKIQSLVESGTPPESITTNTPYAVEDALHQLRPHPSPLRLFTLGGAVSGGILAFAFIIFTVLHWPLITGGKPLISIPAFIIVAFECTILLGGIFSFLGFLYLTRLPDSGSVKPIKESENRFVVSVGGGTGGQR